ncbi:MAG TPA: hypothetical protein VIK89_12220, partial [Cytophagaceae bacterium]
MARIFLQKKSLSIACFYLTLLCQILKLAKNYKFATVKGLQRESPFQKIIITKKGITMRKHQA